ncbi:MAG: hypothetical protein QNL98_02580, partial [Mycobacterium sp.]
MTNSKPARRRSRTPYAWLGAGALGVGVWAALAGGAGVAHADSAASDSPSVAGHAARGASATTNSDVVRRPSVGAASRVDHRTPVASVGVSGSRPAAVVSRAGAGLAARVAVGAAHPSASAMRAGGSGPTTDGTPVASAATSATWQPGSILRVFVG